MTRSLYSAKGRRFTPWKNGGGETAEILCHPEGAGFEDFLWRISTAKVDRSGPFSTFAGVNRVLTVIEGGSMDLRFADGTGLTCGPDTGPHPFSGETHCEATLYGEGLLDLNLMVRAPLRGAVLRPTDVVPPGPVLASWLFATETTQDMARRDLRAVTLPATVPTGTLLITVRG